MPVIGIVEGIPGHDRNRWMSASTEPCGSSRKSRQVRFRVERVATGDIDHLGMQQGATCRSRVWCITIISGSITVPPPWQRLRGPRTRRTHRGHPAASVSDHDRLARFEPEDMGGVNTMIATRQHDGLHRRYDVERPASADRGNSSSRSSSTSAAEPSCLIGLGRSASWVRSSVMG